MERATATIAILIIKLEKVWLLLKAIRLVMKNSKFKSMSIFKTTNIVNLKRQSIQFMILLGLFGLGGLATACQENVQSDIPASPIPLNKMVKVLTDIHIAESVNQQVVIKRDTLFEKKKMEHRYEDVFKVHGITGSEYEKAFQYYIAHPDSFDLIYERILDTLTVMSTKLKVDVEDKLKGGAKKEDKVGEKINQKKHDNKSKKDIKYQSIKEQIDSLDTKKNKKNE